MNAILKIIEKRKLYIHLILFKIFIETNGKTNEVFEGNMKRELEELLEDYTLEMYNTATQYLFSNKYVKNPEAKELTVTGRNYIESWAQNFENLNEEEKKELNEKLPSKVVDFFGLLDKAVTIGNFLELLSKIN